MVWWRIKLSKILGKYLIQQNENCKIKVLIFNVKGV